MKPCAGSGWPVTEYLPEEGLSGSGICPECTRRVPTRPSYADLRTVNVAKNHLDAPPIVEATIVTTGGVFVVFGGMALSWLVINIVLSACPGGGEFQWVPWW